MRGNLEIAGEEDGEDGVVEEIQRPEQTSCSDGSILDHPVRDEWLLRNPGVPRDEDNEYDNAQYKHRNKRAPVPVIAVPGPCE